MKETMLIFSSVQLVSFKYCFALKQLSQPRFERGWVELIKFF